MNIETVSGERKADRKLARAMVFAVVRGEPLEAALKRVQEKAKLGDEVPAGARAGYAERSAKIAKMVRVITKKADDAESDES